VFDGIPLLVRDWPVHKKRIDSARKQKPNWFESNHLSLYRGSYRHHVAKRIWFVKACLRDFLKPSHLAETLLDLGCGDGFNSLWLKEFTDRLYGSDYNLIRLIRARRLIAKKATLFLADVLDFPVQDKAFQIVFFNHCLEHIMDDDEALRTINRILKPGGLLILGIPNEGVWWWQLAYRLQPKTKELTDHVHFYTAETIERKLMKAGFRITRIEHIGWGVPHWSLDEAIRQFAWMDDLLEYVGRNFFCSQAHSLYVLATRE